MLGRRRALSWLICHLDYPTVKPFPKSQRWRSTAEALTPSLLCPHRHFQLLWIILLVLIPFQRPQWQESPAFWAKQSRRPSRSFLAVASLVWPCQKTAMIWKKNSIFLKRCTGYWINVCESELMGMMPSSQVIYSFILLLSSRRWMSFSRQVQNVPSRPKKLTVSLALIIIAQAHVSALHTFKDSLRINFQNGIAWEKQTDRSRQLYMCNVYHKKEF